MKYFLLVKQIIIVLILLICYTSVTSQTVSNYEGCTIGVAAGKATSDSRPMIWKTRDTSAGDNAVFYDTSLPIKFVSVISVGDTRSWMGVNEKGFAILNAYAPDLPGSWEDNGKIMRDALGTCATITEFQYLLDSTNAPGGRQTQSNYAVIDSTGAAAMFETGNTAYWKYDALDSNQAPNGYILRTNFSIAGGGNGGIERYYRTCDLIADFYSGDSLNCKNILRKQMRDFSDYGSNPVPVPFPDRWMPDKPFGYIYTNISICRSSSVSTAVIQGILAGESAKLSTMWTILGQPATAIAVPYWPVGETPVLAYKFPTARLCDIAKCIKAFLFDYPEDKDYIDTYKLRDEDGKGLWANTFPAEDSILSTAEDKLQQWRTSSFSNEEILAAESEFAQYAYSKLRTVHDQFLTFNNANLEVSKSYYPYTEITEDTLLNSGDDSQSVFELPFSFEYDGIVYDKIQISTNGWLEFGKGETGSDSGLSTLAQLSYVGAINNERLATTERPSKALAPWWDDLATGSEGEVSYKIEGVSPERKLIVQWNNMQAFSGGSTTTHINFQVHLKETTNTIEFHYGPVTAGSYTGNGASIGFKDRMGGALRFYDLKQDKICYKDELISNINPLTDWPGPDSCFFIKTFTIPTAIDRIVSAIPKRVRLFQNYPNPFNPTTTISYQLPSPSSIEISIYSILGQKVTTLVNKKQPAGVYTIEWDATGFASGVYFYKLKTNSGYVQMRKLILLK